MALETKPRYGFEECLEAERAAIDCKHEYLEVYTRQPDGRWLLGTSEGLDAEAAFESIACRVPLPEVYDKVDFSSTEDVQS